MLDLAGNAVRAYIASGDQPPDLAKDYGASEEAIWDAIRCEVDLKAA